MSWCGTTTIVRSCKADASCKQKTSSDCRQLHVTHPQQHGRPASCMRMLALRPCYDDTTYAQRGIHAWLHGVVSLPAQLPGCPVLHFCRRCSCARISCQKRKRAFTSQRLCWPLSQYTGVATSTGRPIAAEQHCHEVYDVRWLSSSACPCSAGHMPGILTLTL